jgi:hypothetical protein
MSAKIPNHIEEPEGRLLYRGVGVEFGTEEDAGHSVNVELPEGWTKGTPDGDWTPILDDQGRERMSAYKDGTYSAESYVRMNPRYTYAVETEDPTFGTTPEQYVVREVGTTDPVFYSSEIPIYEPDTSPAQAEIDTIKAEALAETEAWLDRHLPSWKSPEAHWEVDYPSG